MQAQQCSKALSSILADLGFRNLDEKDPYKRYPLFAGTYSVQSWKPIPHRKQRKRLRKLPPEAGHTVAVDEVGHTWEKMRIVRGMRNYGFVHMNMRKIV